MVFMKNAESPKAGSQKEPAMHTPMAASAMSALVRECQRTPMKNHIQHSSVRDEVNWAVRLRF